VRRRLMGIVLAVTLAAALTPALAAVPRGLTPLAHATTAAPTVAAVGDIACKNPPGNNRGVCQYDEVAAAIVAAHPTRFLALGDNQYEYGLYREYVDNYDVYFHGLLPITEPAPGNHEYGKSPTADGYFRYFGAAAQGGYYSYDLGWWHVISLNSAICSPYYGAPCGPGTPQYEWLKADLAAHPAACTLAYWHHPLFDWEKYQNNHWIQSFDLDRSQPFWDLLYAAGADVILTGHNHNYQRYLPMDPQGNYDPKGIVQFIVGTGGRNTNNLGSPSTKPLTFVTGQSTAFGFLDMTLKTGGYDWRWIGAPGQPAFVDAGSATCH
jgi:hypothetical protein